MDNLLFKSGNSGQVNVDQAQGIVECFVAGIGNKDSVGDIVVTGAFAKSLLRRKPRVVWGHSWNDPIGKVLEMYEVAVGDSRLPAKMRNAGIGGLYAKVQFNLQSEKGKEAFATVAFFGEDQEWSIGYKTIDSIFDPNLQANVLKELELYEVSPVLHGANQLTGTISIKADEKGHMPIIPMQGGGVPVMPMMDQMPRIVVVSAPNNQQDESSTDNPFAEGMSRELGQPEKTALQAELTDRTGSQIEVMNATENIVVFRRTTSDGKASMYRLPYHKEGNLYMFGKPEPYQAEAPQPQTMQNIQQKPGAPVVVPNGGIAYRNDDQQEMMNLFGGNVAMPFEKSDVSHLIELPESYMSEAKDYLNPVLRHHKLAGRPSSKGIIIDGLLTANALDALQNAVKALGATIGQSIGKVRDLAQTFNPYALDGDGDGFVQDGSTFQRPYIPVKKPGFDLPDVRGRKRSGDSLLDKPKATPKLPTDKNTWTRAQRNDALTSGMMEPETREDIAFLANRRPENEGVAKYWDMSAAELTVEGNKLVNARRQATGAEKEKIDEELLKVSHDFQRRASYSETFGQEFVPPAKREMPADMVPEADKPKPADRSTDAPSAEVLAERRRERDLDRQADAAIDQALEQYIEEYGEDAPVPGFASTGDKPFSNTEVLMEVARRDGWKGGDRQPSKTSYDKANEALNDWNNLSEEERSSLLDNDEPTIKQFVDALLEARDTRLSKVRADRKLRTDAERKRRSDEVGKVKKFARGDLSGVETNGLLDVLGDDTDDYGNASPLSVKFRDYARQNWKEMSQKERDTAMRDSNTVVDDPDSVVETLRDALMEYGYKNPKYKTFLDDLQSIVDEENEMSSGLASGGGDERQAERGRGGRLGSRPDDAEYRREQAKQREKERVEREKERVDRGSYPEDSKFVKAFDAVLDKYFQMWGFYSPDEDDKGWDEPFGFASRGNNEEVKQEKLDELVEGVRVRLLAELETADPATWKPSWRNDALPINATTGKPYRGFNAFWLMLRAKGEQYKTGRYAGFNQLKARGAQVRKGEKGVPILRPQLVQVTDDEGNVKEFVKFRGTTVFNIDQADGGDEELRAIPADLPEEQRIAILDTTISELGIDVRTENETPHYSPTEDYISMPEFAKGTSPLEWSSTLAHETVHWTGGASRLNRPSVAKYGTDKSIRAYEELVAEIGSAMLLAAHGIEAPFRQDHAPYIKGWLKLLTDDPDALGRAFKDAQAALNHLLEKSPNLRKLFGGLDNGKKAPDVDAPDKVGALVGASDGFASLHRVRTPRSEALTGILYDDNSGDLMVGFQKGKPWEKLTEGERENWTRKAEDEIRDRGGLSSPAEILNVAKDNYDDSRDTGWYVYSDVTMDEVEELAAVKSKGKHINALKKLKTARKATDEDSFNFFGRDERPQDVAKAKSTEGFASRGAAEPNEGLRRHKLMPAEVRKSMPDLYSTEDVPLEDKVLAAKFFSPYSNWTWYAVEFDGEDTFFGYVEGFENEWGNFSLNEIAGATLGGSLPAVERDTSFRPIKFGDLNKGDGFASKLGVEPRFQDSEWVGKTQQRILRSGVDFQSLPENDRIDWANSFLDEWLRENDMGYGLSDVANGKRINKRPDIDLLNYAEDAYARMSDMHASRRAQFGEETQGLASVGNRTRRLGIQPSEAVDYVSYDPDSESLFVAYKREDGRGDMYVYEGVDMDDAIGIENAASVGRAINDIKRRKNVRKATPDEVIGLSKSDDRGGKELRRRKGVNTATAIFDDARHSKNRDVQLEINADRISVDDDGTATWTSADDTMRYAISMDADGGYTVTSEKLRSGGRDEPDEFETVSSVRTDSQPDAITALFEAAKSKIAGDIEEQELDRELAEAKRELDMSGDAPGVISLDVTYSSALDAVDYNPSTQEMRVSFKDGGTYIYEGVDRETFDGFSTAPSKGRAMNEIKRAYPYRKDSEWAGGGDEDGGVEEFDVRGSDAVEKVSYDPETEDLLVVYAGGKGYVYKGVTREEADAVRSAPSKGRAINDVKRAHEVRLLKGEDIRLFGGKKDSPRKDEATTPDVDELRTFIDEQEGLLEVMELNGESAEKIAQQRELVEKAKLDLSAGRTTTIDPAPVAKPRIPTSKPPRGGKRVRNRNVVISMEQGDLDEIIAAESGGTTVDALRAAKGVGKYTKGPRKGKRRGPDTIAVRDAETGELLHFNEIELTSSSARGYVGRKQGQSPTGKKRGFIRARSYTGRQNHKIVGDEGPSLRGEGKGMTEYDKRVYGLGSDEKNREFGLASLGSKPVPYNYIDPFAKPTPREELRNYENYLDSEYGVDFMDYTQMSDEEVKQEVMRNYRMSRSEANAFVKKLRKDEEKYDDLWIAADNATDDDEDGFASRYAKGDYASGYGGSNAVDPDWEFPSNFEPRGQNEDDYLSLPKEVREMLWDMTMDKRKNIGSWEDYYRESISLGASYRVPNVENQPNALNAWQLLAPSEGQRGQSGAYKQWNVKIVKNARDGYDVVKSFGKLEDGDAISPRSNRGSLREQKIGTTLNYGRALEMARQAVSEKVNEGKGYRVTRTNDRGARSEQNIGPGLTQTEKDVAKAVATMRSGTVGSPRMSSQSAGDGFASRMPNDGERILQRGNRDFLSDEFSPSEYRMAMSGLDKVRKGDGKVSPQEEAAIRKLANLYKARPTIKPNERFAINEVLSNVNRYAAGQSDGFASRSMSDSARNPDGDTFKSFKKVIARESGYEFDDLDGDYQEEIYNAFLDGTADPVMIANDIADEMDALSDDYKERQIGFGSSYEPSGGSRSMDPAYFDGDRYENDEYYQMYDEELLQQVSDEPLEDLIDLNNSKIKGIEDGPFTEEELTKLYEDGDFETIADGLRDKYIYRYGDNIDDTVRERYDTRGFGSRGEGNGPWGSNMSLDPDDPELSDGYIEDYVHDYVFEGGNFDFEDLVKYNRRKTVSDEELQKLYDDYLSDDTKISDEAADTIERTFFNEIVDDRYDAMLEQYRSRFDYRDEDDGFRSRGDSGEGFASSADEDRLVAAWRATSKKLDEPVVKGEKSPILDMSSLDFDSHRGGGSKFTPRSESTYDIYGPVNMPIYQPEAVFTTRFADQIVKDFSRSDLTIEELADRFDLTPTQVYEVLDNAKEDMLILDGIRAGKYRSDPYQIKNLEKVEKIFVGNRKHTDIPEPTGEALAKKERRMEIQRADAANDITRQNYSDALKKLKYTDEYTQAETGYNKTRRENEQREYWLEKNRLLQNNIDDLEGTDEDNLSILTGALAGDDILEILQDSGVDFRDPTSDWYEDDNGTMRDGDGDEVSYEDLEWDSFDIDLESLSAEERQKLSDEVESTKNLIRTRAQDARKELGLSENPNSTDIRMAVKAGNTVAREPITKLENELSKKFPLVPVPEEQKRSSLYGFVDADGNKVDYRKLATQYEKIQEARRAEFDARRASGMTIAEASREDDGFASRSTTKPSVDADTQKNIERASLGQLANMIQDDLDEQGKKLYFGAVPYIDALSTMDSMDDRYGADSAQSIVAYTLSNLSTYKGAKARAIKAELKKRLDAKVDKDGFGSRGDSYKKYESGWDGIIQSLDTSPDMNAARAFPSWDDLDYDEQNEFVHEVDYDYMFDNHGDLGDDGIVEAMEDGTYDDAINEHAAMVWDTITERKEKERLTAAVTGPAKESATGTFYTVDHWYNNDARHDEFLDRADGNLGEAMNMSYEEFLDGFASMGSDDEELFYDDERRPRRGSRRFASDSEYGEDNEEAANMRRRDDGFASRGSDLSDEDKKGIIEVAKAMGNRYTNSVVGQYNRDGDLSDAQWDALDRMTKRFDKESGEYVRNTRLVEKRQAERDARLGARGGNTSDGFASIYPKDEDGLERFINQQELELEDYAIMSELEPDKYPISGLESTKKRIATAKRDLARIQKNKPQPVEEDEEFLASIDGFASSSTREADFPDDYEADMTDIAAQDVASNFTRLSKDDQNMYFQRALTNNADSGMTTDQILDEARKLAMDDRQMAILERQAIGMGGSSKPRKLDVSSSSALNSVSYDEMNESLQVEYRGRDGQGTGTLYTYEGVTPDVVDRIEAADSRGATMREIRDNFEFTTSRKLPDSAYEGLASRSETERLASWKPVLRDLRSLKDRVNGNEINDGLIGVGDMDVKPGSDFFRGRYRAYMGLMNELDEIIANAQEEGNLDLEGPTEKSRARFERLVNAGDWVQARFHMEGEIASVREKASDPNDGFASRGSINESSTGQRIVPSRMHSDDREALAEITDPEERKQRIDELIEFYGSRIFAKPSSPKRKKIVQTQDENGYWVGPDGKPADFDFEDGLASRGGRKSSAEYADLVDSLPNPTDRPSMNRYMQAADGARNVTEDRYALIHARRKIAKEMAEANGVEWKDGISIYDVTDDDDDLEILMDLDSRIDELNDYVTGNDKEYRRVRGLEQTVYKKSSELSEIKDSIDQSIEEYDFYKNDPDIFPGKPTPEELADDLKKAMKRHLRDLVDHEDHTENRSLAREYSEDIAEAKTLIDNGTPEDLRKAAEILNGVVDKQTSDYDDEARRLDYEGDELLDSGYRPVELRDEEFDYNSDGDDNWNYSDDIDEEDGKFNVIADELYGPEPTDADVVNEYMGVSDGLASRGNRRRPGRRNQGGQGQRMAPKTSYSDEERQNLADGNILKSRTRPGKRRTGPSVDEFDGFASRDDVAELPTDERVVFEGGEHGPGKEISLNQMWRNYLKSIPRSTLGGRTRQGDKWGSTEPGVGATFADFMERFGPDSPVGLDAESVRQLMNARTPGKKEVFIDDMALAENLATALGAEKTSLFGFDPQAYYDDDGKAIDFDSMAELNPATDAFEVSDEQMDAITEQERARRVARMAARGNRLGKRDVIQRRPTSSGGASSEPVGEMSLTEFEAKLQKTFGQPVRLTDDDGNALPAERMKANIEKSGIPFPFTSIEPFRQMQKRQILPYEYAKELVKMGVLEPSDLPSRASSSLGEFSQWPGFVKANVKMPAVVQALAEVGIDIGEKNRRSIQQGLSDAKKGALRKINTGKLRGDSVLIPMAKLKEMVERLGLDADEFAKWFSSTFTPSADKN